MTINRNGQVTRKASQQGAFQRIVMEALVPRAICRAVFLLCGIQGCTIDEAAALLGIAPAIAARDRVAER